MLKEKIFSNYWMQELKIGATILAAFLIELTGSLVEEG
jgi:hypothetical protein